MGSNLANQGRIMNAEAKTRLATASELRKIVEDQSVV